jgi:hypothetical protein
MTLFENNKQWLHEAGYKYYCFISYPNTKSKSLIKIIDRLREDIFDYLAQSIDNPELFIDKKNIKGGDKWAQSISENLCRSVAMIAVVTELYYDTNHKWCGWEWKNMFELSSKRLPDNNLYTIIPILIRKCEDLPSAIQKIQFYDISGPITSSKKYYQTNDYHRMISEIGEQIKNIAKCLVDNNAIADCEDFEMIQKSAFIHIEPYKQRQPRYKVG